MTYTKMKIAVEVEVPDGATHYSTWSDGTIMMDEDGDHYWWMFDGKEWYLWIEISKKWVYEVPDNLDALKPIEVIE